MAGVTAEPSDFWNDLQDLGLVGDAPGVPQFRGPRSSAPGCFTSMPATPPGQRSASPGGPRPSSLIAAASQGMHNSSPSSPAAPAGRLQHGVMSGSGRQSASMPGNVPLPASHEQAYKVGVSPACVLQGHMPWPSGVYQSHAAQHYAACMG